MIKLSIIIFRNNLIYNLKLTIFLSGCTRMDSLLYFFLISSRLASGSTCRTSNGFKLKYVDPGLSNLSICCLGVKTESLFSISLT